LTGDSLDTCRSIHRCSFLAKLNQLVILIQVIPQIILRRPLCSRKNLGFGRKTELFGGILAFDVALVILGAGLVVVDLIGVNLSAHKILPIAMAALDGLGHELGILVVSSDNLEDIVATRDLVVLRVLAGVKKRRQGTYVR
jgi:hypothetical protein